MSDTTPFEHPDRIGPYHVVQVIGEGGMGVVYEAEQKTPVRRRVAVKMMKIGMDTKEVVGRFEAERQALAVMDHPGIAKVFDAGATEEGRPYFAMELVRGLRVDEYCDQHTLTTRQRVELFILVCEAVQHAHQKGVIHRDLKPSNVLVTESGGSPTPRIIDFGVAKATGLRLTEETVVTMYGQGLGTLAYMSPEQAEMGALDVDTRSDIYSLSVLLHELLTGKVPLDPSEVGAPAFLAQLVQRDQTMPTLSGRLATLGRERLGTVARLRGTDGDALRKQLKGDLQWIVQKGLEKDRGRRYETAIGLALDLQRYLEDRPVSARPPSAMYRVRKFVRRNTVSSALAVTMALGLVGFATSTSVQARRLAFERDRAEQETAKAQAVNDFMESVLLSADPLNALGPTVTVLEAMDSAVAALESKLSREPQVDASARNAMGLVYFKLGRYDQAEALLRDALLIRLEALGEEHLDVAESLFQMSRVLELRSDFDSAEVLVTRSLDLRRRLIAANDPRLAEALILLGGLLTTVGRFDEAEGVLQEARSIHQAADADGVSVADVVIRLGALHRTMGDLESAEVDFRDALSIRERHLPENHPLVGESLNSLAVVLDDQGKAAEAAPIYARAISLMEATYGPESDQVSPILSNLALVLTALGEDSDAEVAYRRALTIDRAVFGDDHLYVGIDLQNLGRHLCLTGAPEEGVGYAESTVQIFMATFEPTQWEVGAARSGYGLCLARLGRFENAEPELLGALSILEAALPPEHAHVETVRARLGELYDLWGKPDQAAQYRRPD